MDATLEAEAPARPPAALPELRQRGVVGAFMFAHFTHHVANALLTPLLPFIRDSFALSYTQSGLLVSAFAVSQGLSQAPIGAIADRVGSRRVVVGGLLATALCCFLIGLSGSYWQLFVALVALGVIAGTYHAPAAALLGRLFPEERRGRILGLHTVGGNLSFLATPLVAGGLASLTLTWRTPYLWFGLAPLAAGVFLTVAMPRLPRGDNAPGGSALFADLGRVWRAVGPLVGIAIISQMLYAGVVAFLALYLVDARGLEPALAAVLVGVPFVAGLAGSPLGGLLSDRVGRKPVIVFCVICVGPLLLALAAVPTALVVPVLLLLGLVTSMRQPVIEGLLLDRAVPERRATTLGAYYFVAQELGGLAAPGIGLLAGTVGIAQAVGWVAVGAALLSALVLGFRHRL